MTLKRYFEGFVIQTVIEKPDGFGGTKPAYQNGGKLSGLFVPRSGGTDAPGDTRKRLMEGSFLAAAENAKDIGEGMVLRRERDGLLLRLAGKAETVTDKAVSQFCYVRATETEGYA